MKELEAHQTNLLHTKLKIVKTLKWSPLIFELIIFEQIFDSSFINKNADKLGNHEANNHN